MRTKSIATSNLIPGMQIAKDVYNDNLQLLVPKGIVLTNEIINRLQHLGIGRVQILIEEPQDQSSGNQPETRTQKVRQTQEFIEYNNQFRETASNFSEDLSNIVLKDGDINIPELFTITDELLSKTNSSYQVFDMLHSLRHFDDSTFAHSLNVSIMANVVGKWLNYSEENLKILTVSGLLHDCGKLLIPNEIIAKPSTLTPEELATVRQHTVKGYELLAKHNIDARISQTALFHHEKCDGSGYPLKLKGDTIPTFARVICIIDVYEAMTADRVYRKGMCPFEVIRTFESEGYLKYDPKILLTFMKGIAQTYLHKNVLLSDGRQGEIIMINEHAVSQPIVRVESDFLDLTRYPQLKIVEIL